MSRARSAALGLALAFVACRGAEPLPADAVARVGGDLVLHPEFEAYLRRQVGDGAGGLDSEVLSGLFDQFLDERLLARWAVDTGLAPPGSGPARAREALAQSAAEAPVTPEEVAAYWRQHDQELSLPARVRLRHILAPDAATAAAAREAILGGEPFAEVARRVSIGSSAADGGDQGELAIADLPGPFAAAVAELPPGEVSPVLRGGEGFHLFLVEEHRPAAAADLEAVSPIIEDRLRSRRVEAALDRALERAREREPVAVFSQNLPFHYEGAYRDDQPDAADRR